MTVKRAGAPVGERYVQQSLRVEGDRVRRLHAGDFDPTHHAQQPPEAVLAAIEAVHKRSGSPLEVLVGFVHSALTWRARPSPVSPECGSVPLHPTLNPAAVQHYIDTAGPRHLHGINWLDVLTCGADDLYSGSGQTYVHPNHPSVLAHLAAATAMVEEEEAKGYVIDVTEIVKACPLMYMFISAIALVPKANGKWRMIDDESAASARGTGPNSYVNPSRLSPCPLDSIATFGAQLWRLRQQHPHERILMLVHDGLAAYRQILLRVNDMWRHLFQLNGRVYVATRELFGSRASGFYLCPITYSVAASVAASTGGAAAAFVDDSAVADIAPRFAATDALFMQRSEVEVRMMQSEQKLLEHGPPSTNSTWIGVDINTDSMTASIGADKHQRLLAMAQSFCQRRRVLCSELQEALGLAAFVAQVVQVLGACLAEVGACIRGVPTHHYVTLTADAKAQLITWAYVLEAFNGTTLMPVPVRRGNATEFSSDASNLGLGFLCERHRIYASEPWPTEAQATQVPSAHINKLELLAATLGFNAVADAEPASPTSPGARGVHAFCDSSVACAHIGSLGARSPHLAPITRLLAAACAHKGLFPFVTQVRSEDNADADALSRLAIPTRLLDPSWTRLRFSAQQLLSLISASTHPLDAASVQTALSATAAHSQLAHTWHPPASSLSASSVAFGLPSSLPSRVHRAGRQAGAASRLIAN